jgi:signal transduction protein with GAF and PtsI domain
VRTERVTFLTTPDHKAALDAYAASNGKSVGHVVPEATSQYIAKLGDEGAEGDEAELAALVAEANAAIPQMRASIDRMIDALDASHRKVDAFLREAGVRT